MTVASSSTVACRGTATSGATFSSSIAINASTVCGLPLRLGCMAAAIAALVESDADKRERSRSASSSAVALGGVCPDNSLYSVAPNE